jgi:hypothetical protein
MSATAKQLKASDAELWCIAESGDVDELARVFANGAQVNARNKHGMTALMKAAYHGHARMVRALLARGADPNLVRNDQFTALALAAFFGHTETVKILIEHGAKPEVLTRCGTSAQTWATRRTYLEAARCLESHAQKPEPTVVAAPVPMPTKTTHAFRYAAVVVVCVACAVGVLEMRKSRARSLPVEPPAKQSVVVTEVSAPVSVESTKIETPVEEPTPQDHLSHHSEPSSSSTTPARKVVLTRQTRPRAMPEDEQAPSVQSKEVPVAAPVIASPQVPQRSAAASKPNTSLSPQLIAPAKSATPKGKVIQWP